MLQPKKNLFIVVISLVHLRNFSDPECYKKNTKREQDVAYKTFNINSNMSVE